MSNPCTLGHSFILSEATWSQTFSDYHQKTQCTVYKSVSVKTLQSWYYGRHVVATQSTVFDYIGRVDNQLNFNILQHSQDIIAGICCQTNFFFFLKLKCYEMFWPPQLQMLTYPGDPWTSVILMCFFFKFKLLSNCWRKCLEIHAPLRLSCTNNELCKQGEWVFFRQSVCSLFGEWFVFFDKPSLLCDMAQQGNNEVC